jgi:hypothetical protein
VVMERSSKQQQSHEAATSHNTPTSVQILLCLAGEQ